MSILSISYQIHSLVENIFDDCWSVSYLNAKPDSTFAEVWREAVLKSYSKAPVVKDAHDNLYTVNARYVAVTKINNNIDDSKPGKSRGRKATGLK